MAHMPSGSNSGTSRLEQNSHVNLAFSEEDGSNSSESSESFSDDMSSTSLSDEEYEPEWCERVGARGDLFYVEPAENLDPECEGRIAAEAAVQDESSKVKVSRKSKPTTRLKQWVDKHKTKKKQNSSDSYKNCQNESLSKTCTLPKVTFQASPNGEIKELSLDVDPKRHNYGRRATLCEVLFGIIPGRFNQPLGMVNTYSNDSRVMVHGFTPDGEAIKNGSIKIGDWLKSVDGRNVTMDDINEVLATITTPCKVKLVVQRFAGHSSPPAVRKDLDKENFYSPLVKQLTGDRCTLEEVKASYHNIPHILLYLSIGRESGSNGEDVLYRYPESDSMLFSLKGMFITLSHMIADVASSPPTSSSLIVQEKLIHVGYIREGREVMVLALPANCVSATDIQQITANVAKVMQLQFQTLGKTFEDPANKDYLDHFCLLFFHHHLSTNQTEDISPGSHMKNTIPSVHWLPLIAEIKTQVDAVLNELESSDFGDMSETHYGIRRLYSILGSCAFYKGYLLASHFTKEDLLDIHLYLQQHHLLPLTHSEPVAQIIVWREVFPSRFHMAKSEKTDPEFVETEGRWFMMIVAIRYSLLGVLLEAGGCTSRAEGHPGPDVFYVDQARNTLLQLESLGIATYVDKCLESSPVPPLASVNQFLNKDKPQKKIPPSYKTVHSVLNTQRKNSLNQRSHSQSSLVFSGAGGSRKMQEVTSILKKRFNGDGERQHLLPSMGPADGESDGDTIQSRGTSEDMTPVLGRRAERDRSGQTSTSSDAESRASSDGVVYKGPKSQRIFASAYDLTSLRKSLDDAEDSTPNLAAPKLVAGCENTLFHYLHMDCAEGVFLAPTCDVQKWLHGPANNEIMKNFYKCCQDIRKIFQNAVKCKEIIKNRQTPKFGLDRTLSSVKEHGVLFQYSPPSGNNPKKTPTVAYWVVGRLFFNPEPREVYVCFHDSAPQNAIELAFRLGFGLSL